MDLYMDIQLFDDRLTKITDEGYISKNPALGTMQKSAILSERENQRKNEFYELEITIGQLEFTKHPLFSPENDLAT